MLLGRCRCNSLNRVTCDNTDQFYIIAMSPKWAVSYIKPYAPFDLEPSGASWFSSFTVFDLSLFLPMILGVSQNFTQNHCTCRKNALPPALQVINCAIPNSRLFLECVCYLISFRPMSICRRCIFPSDVFPGCALSDAQVVTFQRLSQVLALFSYGVSAALQLGFRLLRVNRGTMRREGGHSPVL